MSWEAVAAVTAALAKRGPLPTCLSRLCSEPNLLVRACNQLGQFLQHRETNLRYLALESMCTLASSEFSHEAVKTHIETVINALKASALCPVSQAGWELLVGSGVLHARPRGGLLGCVGPWVVLRSALRCCAHGQLPWVWHVSRPAIKVEVGSNQKKKEKLRLVKLFFLVER